MNIKGTLHAYIRDLTQCDMEKLKQGDIKQLTFSTHADMQGIGWVHVGQLDVDFAIVSDNELVNNAVAALRAKAAEIRAEATAKCTQIEGQINQLLCIENGAGHAEV